MWRRSNIDETSWRETNKRAWLWTTVTALATLFLIVGSRRAGALTTMLGATFHGIVGSDRWRPSVP